MIIWINGAFGSGKSSVAESICKKLNVAHLYDPEQIGYFLWDNFPEEMTMLKSSILYLRQADRLLLTGSSNEERAKIAGQYSILIFA